MSTDALNDRHLRLVTPARIDQCGHGGSCSPPSSTIRHSEIYREHPVFAKALAIGEGDRIPFAAALIEHFGGPPLEIRTAEVEPFIAVLRAEDLRAAEEGSHARSASMEYTIDSCAHD